MATAARAAAEPKGAPTIDTSVPYAVLIDVGSGTVLYDKGADALVSPASTTKLMTAEIVFQRLKAGSLRLDQTFHVSQKAWKDGGAKSGGSTMFAKLNSDISVDDLLHGLIVDSGNDAAITLAEGIAGSENAFAALMTKRARELGFTHMTFTDAWGDDDPRQKVTAREMARLAEHIIDTYPDYYKIFDERSFTWNKIKQPNRNPLLAMNIGADGLKTGHIKSAGYALVGSAVENGRRLIVAIYGATKATERAAEARKLLLWGFRDFEERKLFAAGDTVAEAWTFGGATRTVPLTASQDVKVLVRQQTEEKITAKVKYTGPLLSPVEAGKMAAVLKVYSGTNEILSVPLRTAHAVPVGPLWSRAFDAAMQFLQEFTRKYASPKANLAG